MAPSAASVRRTRSKRTKPAVCNDDVAKGSAEQCTSTAVKDDVQSSSFIVNNRQNEAAVVVTQKVTRPKTVRGCKRIVSEIEPDVHTRPKRSKRTVSKADPEDITEASEDKIDTCYVKVTKVEEPINGNEVIRSNETVSNNVKTVSNVKIVPSNVKTVSNNVKTVKCVEAELKTNELVKDERHSDIKNGQNVDVKESTSFSKLSSVALSIPQTSNVVVRANNLKTSTETGKFSNRSKALDDNMVTVPCRCSKKIQCFGPYSEGAYSSKKIYGNGVEIMKCLKHETSLMAGFVKIDKESCMSGIAKNNTVYFVLEGSLRVDISGKVKHLKRNECFMVIQDTTYEIRNTTREPARLNFVKTPREQIKSS